MDFSRIRTHSLKTMKKLFQALRMSETEALISSGNDGAQATAPGRRIATGTLERTPPPPVIPSVPGRCRMQKRAKLNIPTRLRPADPGPGGDFDETLITQNVSKDGLYLGNARQSYCEGMRVLVTFPSVAAEPQMIGEYDGQVVRVDRPDNAPAAVAVKLLAPKTTQA
jgi:hypothetical protein